MLERLKKLLRVTTLDLGLTNVIESTDSIFLDTFDFGISQYIKSPENHNQKLLLELLDVVKEYDLTNGTNHYITLVKKYNLDRFI